MLSWANRFNIFCFLDNHQYAAGGNRYECLLGAGVLSSVSAAEGLPALDAFIEEKEWVFGHLSYELKQAFFPGSVAHPDPVGFPPFFFFEPEFVMALSGHCLEITATDPDAVFTALQLMPAPEPLVHQGIQLQARLTREEYLEVIRQLQFHIRRGDCYEINFCQEFFAKGVSIQPLPVYEALVARSPVPFAACYRMDQCYALCASPERFLQRSADRLIAQPMKGTGSRVPEDVVADREAAEQLRADPKEQAENVMIVDLMRNDLSRVCEPGSVKVSELFGVYSYPLVHQMVSTIEGELRPGTKFSQILEASFPMGSMTGAPKKRVIELIDRYEQQARGLFSGSIGYFHKGDFDFNVVIRSIFYNEATRYLSYQAGSGITHYSQPEKEWEECLLKGAAIKKVLTG